MEKVLVAGATGTTGKQIINLLSESQYFEPHAMIRMEDQNAQFKAQNVKWIMGDLSENIEDTCKNMDKVIFAAGSGGKNVKEIDQEGAKKLMDASMKHHIRKFVMLSSLGADQPEKAEDLKEYLEAKHNADKYLKNSKLNYAIVRPGSLTNDGATNHIKLSHKLDQKGEISRADVAQTLVRVLNDDTANRETFEIIKGDTLISKAVDTMSKVNL
ncbi:SDR family oxidoreductase [Nonlabens sp.]|uniref:SDR family oxidoreductase n=1 Tax=Nonlabens sp. TaxID=1888209 RepID=UPI003F6953C6